MRPRSITGPLILVLIGLLFLMNNLGGYPGFWSMFADYWPAILIIVGVVGLAEVLFHTSRGTNPPPRPVGGAGMWIGIAFLIAIFTSAQRGMNVRWFDGPNFTFMGHERDYDVNATENGAGIARVLLESPRGDVTLHGEEAQEIHVTGHKMIHAYNNSDADRANQEAGVHMQRDGDLLTIRVDPTRSNSSSLSADLNIAVPKGVSFEMRGRNGDVSVENVTGSVNLSTGRGDVHLNNIGNNVRIESTRINTLKVSGINGNVEVNGRGGEVQIQDVQGETTLNGEYSGTLEFRALQKQFHFKSQRSDFTIASIPGRVVLDLGDLRMDNVTGPVRFTTGSRDVHATDVTNSIELNVDRGDIEIDQSKSPMPKVDIRSRHGDVTLAVPAAGGFDLDGHTGQGEVSNDFGSALQTRSEGRGATISGHAGSGPKLTVVTDRGSITVRKN
jgi:DUF4097 and DUF4098 domain-containing protein YvlB